MFPRFEIFCQVMDACTSNFECLVINNNSKSNKIADQVFWYKAANHPDFRLCSPEAWRFHEANLQRRFLENGDEDDFGGGGGGGGAGGGRRGPYVEVHKR